MSHHKNGRAQGSAQRIADLWLYLLGNGELSLEEKVFLYTVARQHWARKNWTARQHELARLFSCSPATIKRRIVLIAGRHGWITKEWRGGHQSNVYAPGWRLSQLMARVKK